MTKEIPRDRRKKSKKCKNLQSLNSLQSSLKPKQSSLKPKQRGNLDEAVFGILMPIILLRLETLLLISNTIWVIKLQNFQIGMGN